MGKQDWYGVKFFYVTKRSFSDVAIGLTGQEGGSFCFSFIRIYSTRLNKNVWKERQNTCTGSQRGDDHLVSFVSLLQRLASYQTCSVA